MITDMEVIVQELWQQKQGMELELLELPEVRMLRLWHLRL